MAIETTDTTRVEAQLAGYSCGYLAPEALERTAHEAAEEWLEAIEDWRGTREEILSAYVAGFLAGYASTDSH